MTATAAARGRPRGALRSLGRRIAIPVTRSLRAISRDRSSGVSLVEFRGRTLAIRRDSSDEEVLEGFQEPFYLPEVPPGEVRVAIKVGGHLGLAALEIAAGHPSATVHVLEPHPDSFTMLTINIALAGLSGRVIPHRLALRDCDGTVPLRVDAGNWGHSTATSRRGRELPVESQTLQTFLDRRGIEACDLLISNCEGAEFGILSASNDATLRRVTRWVILVHEDLAGSSLTDLIDRLTTVGFSAREHRSTSDRCWIVAERTP